MKAIAEGLSAVAPNKVIWKLSDSDLVMLGDNSLSVNNNVRVVKWVPQNDLLGHPNVKVFFTQCSSNSFNEVCMQHAFLVGPESCVFSLPSARVDALYGSRF